MTEPDANATTAAEELVPGFADIGARLRGARERVGLSVAQAAERMHCDRRLVEALDAGRFAQLGAPVFARGHIRRYAELLGEPVGEVLERWDREAAGHVAPPDLTAIPKARRTADTRRFLLPLGVAAIAAVFAALIAWVLRDSPLPAIGGLEVPVAAAPAVTESPPVAGAGSGDVATNVALDGTADAAANPPAAALPEGVDAPTTAAPGAASAAAPAPAPASAGSATVALQLRASADCWVEIYDSNRKQLYFGMLRAGASASVTGRGPLRMLLGNVSGVAVDVNGRRASVPAALRRTNTANVRVAADGTFSASARD